MNTVLGILANDNECINEKIESLNSLVRQIGDTVETNADSIESIQRRMNAQHLRVIEFIHNTKEEITLDMAHSTSILRMQGEVLQDKVEQIQEDVTAQGESIIAKIDSCDKANDYLIKQMEKLAGHPNK